MTNQTNARFFVNGNEIPLSEDLSITTSYLIADVRDPSTINSDITIPISIPSTLEIDKVFGFCFQLNVALQNFNPNLDTPVVYMINNVTVLTGSMQLTDIEIDRKDGNNIYVCNIKGKLSDLIYKIGDAFMTDNDDSTQDLDFSTYNHTINNVNYENTWFPTIVPHTNKVAGIDTPVVDGIGYRYALIDYGYNGGDLENYYVHHMRPIIFDYEILKKIFLRAGKTWTSSFLESNFFKKIAIECTEALQATDTDYGNRTCYVGQTVYNWSANTPLLSTGIPTNYYWNAPGVQDSILVFNTRTGLPYNDAGSMYDTATGITTFTQTNNYNIQLNVALRTKINCSTPGAIVLNQDIYCVISMDKFISGSWVDQIDSNIFTQVGFANNMDETFTINWSATFLTGEQIRFRVHHEITNVKLDNGTPIVLGTADYDVFDDYVTNPFLSVTTSKEIYEGDTLELNRIIPKKIKQKDFFLSIVKKYRLMVLPDKNDTSNYFIEPWNDFYTGTYVNWSNKLDITERTKVKPVSELDSKQFIWRYKQDGDYYNKTYQDSWGDTYGQKIFQTESVFVQGENTTELIFSPTPLIGNDINGLIIPKIYKNENSVVSPLKHNIRQLYWGGALTMNVGSYNMREVSGIVRTRGVYPYAGHLDNPYTPTIDLCFDIPPVFYYTLPGTFNYTANNIFNVYHRAFITFITDKNAKMVIERFILDEIDISKFDFRDQVYYDGSYYLVNAIKGFNLLERKATMVELLKLQR